LTLSTTNGSEDLEVPYFIRFSAELIEAARSIGISLFQESSHKTVEATIQSIQTCLGPEDEDEDDGRHQQRGNGTGSSNNSPDVGPSSSRASNRLVQKANPVLPTASEVRGQQRSQSQIKSARVQMNDPLYQLDDSFVVMNDKAKLENMKLKADGCTLVKAVRLMF
jgi:hypothetical protein